MLPPLPPVSDPSRLPLFATPAPSPPPSQSSGTCPLPPLTTPPNPSLFPIETPKIRRWQQNWQFPTKKAIDSALQLSSALSYLHCRAVEGSFVVHRDLKPENIAFGSDGRLKLFGE